MSSLQQQVITNQLAADNRATALPYSPTEVQPQRDQDGLSFYQKLKLTKSSQNLKIEGMNLCNAPTQGVNQIAHPKAATQAQSYSA